MQEKTRCGDKGSSLDESDKVIDFPVVGIGASAGGLEAIIASLKHIPRNAGVSFVIVCHHSPDQASLLPSILSNQTDLDVREIGPGSKLEVNVVYVCPSGHTLKLEQNEFILSEFDSNANASLPIDIFMESLAKSKEKSAIGILLSGNGMDGSKGLQIIKEYDGLTIAQDPATAKHDSMPNNAISKGYVNSVLKPEGMWSFIADYFGLSPNSSVPQTTSHDADMDRLKKILPEIIQLLDSACGHDFSNYKTKSICRRIQKRINLHQITDPQDYLDYMITNSSEVNLLFNELLIGVTSFFRDPLVFKALLEVHLPKLLATKKGQTTELRIWVPGCSTGEEAYSISMVFFKAMSKMENSIPLQIFATDLDESSIETARKGIYPTSIVDDVEQEYLSAYFDRTDKGYHVKKMIRNTIVFAHHNILNDPPFTKVDMISCRNVLIYLDKKTQDKILNLFHFSINDGGLLLLGSSETTGDLDVMFNFLDRKNKIFERISSRGETPRPFRHLSNYSFIHRRKRDLGLIHHDDSASRNIYQDIERIILDRFAPVAIVTDQTGNIVYTWGKVGIFLEQNEGVPSSNILRLALPSLQLDISAGLRKLKGDASAITVKNLLIKKDEQDINVDLNFAKISHPKSLSGLVLITLIKKETFGTKASDKILIDGRTRSLDGSLQNEIKYTREALQDAIEELEASNEELKSTNEELQSTNEELQSTNEELETSKEEMKSLNEELQTVNCDLQNKVHELTASGSDMRNLLDSTNIATIFLDNALKIKRFNSQVQDVCHLIPGDIGRSVRDLSFKFNYTDFITDIEQVKKNSTPKEVEIHLHAGFWVLMRIQPYKTSDERLDGFVITFVNIDKMFKIKESLNITQSRWNAIIKGLKSSLVITDGDGCIEFLSGHQTMISTRLIRGENICKEFIDGQKILKTIMQYVKKTQKSKRLTLTLIGSDTQVQLYIAPIIKASSQIGLLILLSD